MSISSDFLFFLFFYYFCGEQKRLEYTKAHPLMSQSEDDALLDYSAGIHAASATTGQVTCICTPVGSLIIAC